MKCHLIQTLRESYGRDHEEQARGSKVKNSMDFRMMDERMDHFINIEDSVEGEHAVSAKVLLELIEGLQEVVWLLGAAEMGKSVGLRFKPSQEIKQRYNLVFGAAQPGSVVWPYDVVDNQITLFPRQEHVLDTLQRVTVALSELDGEKLRQKIPDSSIRSRVLKRFDEFLPEQGDSWKLGFSNGTAKSALLSSYHRKFISESISRTQIERASSEVTTVTGYLIELKFKERKAVIEYPVNGRTLKCDYLEDVELDIIEARRELVHVTGEFTLDSHGIPKSVSGVQSILPVDTSPIMIREFSGQSRHFRLQKPLVLDIEIDEDKQTLIAQYEPLKILAYAPKREQLINEITSYLENLWVTYVEDTQTPKTSRAQEFGKRVSAIMEVSDAVKN